MRGASGVFEMYNAITVHYKKLILLFFGLYLFYVLAVFTTNIFTSPTLVFNRTIPLFNQSFFHSPLVTDDYSLHYTSTLEAVQFFKTKFRIWGYNPYFYAGYISGVFFEIDNHLAFLASLIFADLARPALVFNLTILISYLLLPVFSLFAIRNFGTDRPGALSFFLLSMAFIWGGHWLKSFYYYGMYGFVLSVFMSLYVSSLFYRYVIDKTNTSIIKLLFWASAAFFVHPLASILCLAVCLPILLLYSDRLNFRHYCAILSCVLIVLLANFVWVGPFMKFYYRFNSLTEFFQSPISLSAASSDEDWPLFLASSFLGLIFVYRSVKNRNYRFMGVFLLSYLAFLILAFWGSRIHLSDMQPYRFMLPLILLSIFLASSVMETEFRRKNLLFVIGLILLVGSLARKADPLRLDFGYAKYPAAQKILEYIKNNLSNSGRLHVQDSGGHPYFHSHFSALIPQETSKEIVAGPFPFSPTKDGFAQFVDDDFLGRKMVDIPDDEFRKYLELYNIKYFLLFNGAAKDFFNKHRAFRKIFEFESYAVYEYLDSDGSFCYRCKADVEADFDKISVRNANSSVTVLKYHYVDTLTVVPADIPIKPIRMLQDPNPFIQVENGKVSSFVIMNP
jgi:hypothetical protein